MLSLMIPFTHILARKIISLIHNVIQTKSNLSPVFLYIIYMSNMYVIIYAYTQHLYNANCLNALHVRVCTRIGVSSDLSLYRLNIERKTDGGLNVFGSAVPT